MSDYQPIMPPLGQDYTMTLAGTQARPGYTPPFPVVKATGMKHYQCTMASHNFMRPDGKTLVFIHSHYATDDVYDQMYLDSELATKNPYLNAATDDQVGVFHSRTNTQASVGSSAAAEEALRQRLLEGIKAELSKVGITPEQLAAIDSLATDVAKTVDDVDLLTGGAVSTAIERVESSGMATLRGMVNTSMAPRG